MAAAGVDQKPFFSHLRAQQTHHVLVVGETDDEFDDSVLQMWSGEGFMVSYVPLPDRGHKRADRIIRAEADKIVGVSDRYIIVAFQDAANDILAIATHSLPRLAGVIAYYPATIPNPNSTTYPPGLRVMMHICPPSINVEHRTEMLGLQGKIVRWPKEVDPRMHLGQEIQLTKSAAERSKVAAGDLKVYVYPDCSSGFAESDLDDFVKSARDLAWSRSLRLARAAFGLVDEVALMESARDKFVDHAATDAFDVTTFEVTVNGLQPDDHAVRQFYRTLSGRTDPGACRLLSRTTGSDTLVDQIKIDLKAVQARDWIKVPGQDTQGIDAIQLVSISTFRGGAVVKEQILWHYCH